MDVEALFAACSRLHPRSLQVLLARFVAEGPSGPGRSAESFATFYGVDRQAAEMLLWRAATELEARLAGRPPPDPRPFADELVAARGLAEALASPLPASSPRLVTLVDALRALSSHAPAIRERLAAAEKAELESPQYARETWLRRLAIVLVLALSGWFYFKDDLVRRWRQWTTPVTQPSPQR
ncbi:MAG: hypothetical protein SFW67_25275 [Myxococcaceae bacterium]|nr:hypothetical protein [Myxococcaceae bacterium]